jgi:hypothetical protein
MWINIYFLIINKKKKKFCTWTEKKKKKMEMIRKYNLFLILILIYNLSIISQC